MPYVLLIIGLGIFAGTDSQVRGPLLHFTLKN